MATAKSETGKEHNPIQGCFTAESNWGMILLGILWGVK